MQCLAPSSWSSTVKSSPGHMEIQCPSTGVLVAQRPPWAGKTPPCGSHVSPFLSQPGEDGERARVPGRLVLSEPQTLTPYTAWQETSGLAEITGPLSW